MDRRPCRNEDATARTEMAKKAELVMRGGNGHA